MKEEFSLGLRAATSAMAVGPLPAKALNLSSKALRLRWGPGSGAEAECLPGSHRALREITPGAGSVGAGERRRDTPTPPLFPATGRHARRSCLKLGASYLFGNLCWRKTFASLFDL